MSFTPIIVTRDYTPAGAITSASGTVRFTLSTIMDNGGTPIYPTPLIATLDETGTATITLCANDDVGTLPANTYYNVTENINGQKSRNYQVVIPHDATGGTVQLNSLPPLSNSAVTGYIPFPSIPPTGYVLQWNGSNWVGAVAGGGSGGAVSSVFGRTGVVAAAPGDYTAAQVGALASTYGLPAITAVNPSSSAWSNNSQVIHHVGNGTASDDAAAFGQLPTALPPDGAASGDLSGSYPSPTVAKIQGYAVSGTDPTAGEGLVWNGTSYVPTPVTSVPRLTSTTNPASGTITLSDPTQGGALIQNLIVPSAGALTIVNPPAVAGSKLSVTLTTGASPTITFPTTNTRWKGVSAAGSAPTVAANSVWEFVLDCYDGVNWDWTAGVVWIGGSLATYDTTLLALSPLQYLTFGDLAGTTVGADSSGFGHTLSAASITYGETGIVPSDTETSGLVGTTAATTTYEPSLSAISIAAIVQFSATPTTIQYIYNALAGNLGADLRIGTTGLPTITFGNGTTTATVVGTTAVVANHSYLIVATWDGTTITLYVDDLTAGSKQTPVTGTLSGTYVAGKDANITSGAGFSFYIAREAVFGQALTLADVNSLYSAATTVDFSGYYIGAYAATDNGDPGPYETGVIGRKMDCYRRYYEMSTDFGAQDDAALTEAGRYLFLSLSTEISGSYVQWQDVGNGSQDTYLTALANYINTLSGPVFFNFGTEMDGSTRQDEAGAISTSPNYYAQAYQYIYNLMNPICGPNIEWGIVFSGNNYPNVNAPGTATIASCFPGEWITWIGYDPYDMTGSKGSVQATVAPFQAQLAGAAWAEPYVTANRLAITETGIGSSVAQATQEAWYEGAAAGLAAVGGFFAFLLFNDLTTVVTPGTLAATGVQTAGASAAFNQPHIGLP